jgi:hypothetical protein
LPPTLASACEPLPPPSPPLQPTNSAILVTQTMCAGLIEALIRDAALDLPARQQVGPELPRRVQDAT